MHRRRSWPHQTVWSKLRVGFQLMPIQVLARPAADDSAGVPRLHPGIDLGWMQQLATVGKSNGKT